jgi:Dyp-type peroxidase family
VVKAGEFILGYRNERGVAVSCNGHAAEAPPGADAAGVPHRPRDLRRNGTYLVFRQLEQDVPAFNSFVAQAAKRVHGQATPETEEWVASRLIGRRPSGEPLIGPSADSSKGPGSRNDFLYHFEDRHGFACPIGSHIRRANPRDTIGPDPDTALRLSKMHRIIRRGRPYGERLSRAPDAPPKRRPEAPRGIYFICLNADIAGQFELIQHSWLNNVHFGGLYAGTDPLSHFRAGGDVMTIQRRPMNLHLDGLKPFVKVRGGAYFFLPGIRALQDLAR